MVFGSGHLKRAPSNAALVDGMAAGIAAVVALSGAPGTASAADLVQTSEPSAYDEPAFEAASPWTWVIGAYAFVPLSVEGSSTVNGGTVDLDLGPSEIFDLLEFAISGRVEGWRETDVGDGSAFGAVFDGQYVNLGTEIGGLGPFGTGNIDADIRQGIVDLMAGYRFPRIDLDAAGQALFFDVMAGARYNFLRQKIDVSPGLPFPFTVNLGGDQDWLEPVVGARATWRVGETWDLILRGDLAGFGVNGDELTWSLAAVAAWRAWERTTLHMGYRVYAMDYATGAGPTRFAFDATEHGPYFGISYRY